MISSIQDIEHAMNSYGFFGILLVILSVFNWFFKNLFPYFFRKLKLEKLDEYKDKFKELDGYREKTHVINKIMEQEYGRIFLNERDISKQKIMIFLLKYNLCRTIKEAKKFATYSVFRESKKALIFDKSGSLKKIFGVLGAFIFFLGLCIYCKLQAIEKSVLTQNNTNFEVIVWTIFCLMFYLASLICVLIFSQKIGDSISTYKLIKKNSRAIQKISSRLSELNTQKCLKKEEKNSKEKSAIETIKKAHRK